MPLSVTPPSKREAVQFLSYCVLRKVMSEKITLKSHKAPSSRVRVSGGHLGEAEAPTEAAAETLSAKLTEGVSAKPTNV